MTSPALELRNVGCTFDSSRGSVVALRNVDLELQEHEFVCVVGASGSGKSTLLRLIDGLIAPTSGEVLVGGAPVAGPGRDRAMVFQQDCLLPWQTILDNVAYGLRLAGVAKREAHDTARQYIKTVGLAGFENSFPHQLSGGMRQRANVARALAVDPRIILLDEPFAALDSQTREIMQAELLRIWSTHRKTVVFITHQIDEAVYLADRVVVLSARPGTVREIIDIDLPRPRDLHVKRTAEFGAHVDRVWSLIEVEVRRSMGLEQNGGET
jgi:NitT/TauT family transport system ATP-binding protein